MGSIISQIQEQRFLFLMCLVDKVNRIIRYHIRCIEGSFFIVSGGTVFRQTGIYFRIPERIESAQQSVVLLKTTKNWVRLVPQMPFSRHSRKISGVFQDFRNRDIIRIGTESRISLRPCRVTAVHVSQSCLMRIKSRQQVGTGWATACTVVHLRHPDTILCQFIQHRCMNLTTEAAEIGESQVIRQYDNNIRLVLRVSHRDQSQTACYQ